jgi:predicted MFS family arabinose efflux permease
MSSFLFELARFITQPIFTLYVLEIGGSLSQLGLILSIQSILMVVVRIPFTIIAERIGKSKMLVVAFFIQATSPLLYSFAPNPTWFYILPFYQIIATGSFNQLAMATASNFAPVRQQGDALGRYMTFMSMGMFVGPMITGILLNFVDYKQVYLIATIFPAIGLTLFLKYMPKENTTEQNKKYEVEQRPHTTETLHMILRNRNVLVLTLVRTTYSLSNTVFTSLFALYAVEKLNFTPSLASLLFSVVGFSNAFIKFPAGRLADRLGPKKVLMVTFTTLIFVYISVAYLKGVIPILITLVLFGACWGTRAVTEWATLANIATTETKAIAMSYLSSIWGVGSTLGSILVGLIGGTFPFSNIFLILAFVNIPALPAIYIMKISDDKESSSLDIINS